MPFRPVDFIIAGSMRCGTTSLYYDLACHPEISMSRKKETDYFISDSPPEIYDAQFNRSKMLWGEASPNYSKCDIFPDVPMKIHQHSPNVKLIFLVRDPCDRILSQYHHALAMGNISQNDDVSINSAPMQHMINTSRYYAQLAKFREFFNKNSILIIQMNDYSTNRSNTLDTIAKFIGASQYVWGEKQVAENTSLSLARYPNIMKSLRKNPTFQKIYNAIPHQWQTRVKNLFSHKSHGMGHQSTSITHRNELISILRDDIVDFGREYDIDVSSWLIGETDGA